jgi:hypothetical protein
MKTYVLVAMLMTGSVTGGPADDLPVPPQPPPIVPSPDIAPVPDFGASAPIRPESEDPSLNVKLYRYTPPDSSQGFSPGSRYQSTEDRKAIQTPGFSFSVPLK